MINVLKRKITEKEFLIDKFWFKNFSLYILSDISSDAKSKIFFNFRYVVGQMNKGVNDLYDNLKGYYQTDLEISKKEFVSVKKSFY